MGYLWLKAFHIAAAVTWIGGMLAAAITLAACSVPSASADASDRAAVLRAVRRWDQRVTAPAMLLTWALGLALALAGGWFPQTWLMLKLGFVLLLSALHGVLSGTLRRAARTGGAPGLVILPYSPAAIVAGAVLVAVIVVIKPFS